MFENYIAVPAIVIIVYIIAECIKLIPKININKYIPIICGISGLILGSAAFITIPNFIPATNWLEACAIGVVSGLSATGINQIVKQLGDK